MSISAPESDAPPLASPLPVRWPRVLLQIGRGLAVLYVVVVAVAMVAWGRHEPVIETPAVSGAVWPSGHANLADMQAGGRVRVSSYDHFNSHHPLFVIDGEPAPSLLTKWATLDSDRAPWLEILLAGRADLDAVELQHAGFAEHSDYTMRDYTIWCLRDGEPVWQTEVRDNLDPMPRHEVACTDVDGVRIAFKVDAPESARAVVRLFEVRVWGQPR